MTQNETPVHNITTVDKKPNFIARFRTNHPRATKALAITAGVLLLGGGAYAAGSKNGSSSTADVTEFDEVTDAPSEA